MWPSTLILLALLCPALSKTASHETPLKEDSTASLTAKDALPNREGSRAEENRPIETLFIPEDPSRYAEIVEQVRKLLERADPSKVSEHVENTGDSVDEGATVDSEVLTEVRPGNTLENTSRWELAPENGTKETFSSPLYGEEGDSSLPATEEEYSRRNPAGLSSRTAVGDNGDDASVSVESDDPKSQEKSEPGEEDLLEVANFGLQAMKNLYLVTEPTLYSMGLYLDSDNPAKYVAAFNDQTEEARALAKYGFAVLQSTTMFKKKFPDIPTESLLARRSQSNLLQRHCPNRGVPECPPASSRYRTSDGSCNNRQNLWWGSAMSPMNRFLPPVYGDGVQSVRKSIDGSPLPSARDVTRIIHEDRDVPLASITHMLMQWGQFVDHDLTATGQSRGFNGSIPQCCLNFGKGFQPAEFMHPECLPISVSAEDSFFGPLGVKCLEFLRSGPAPREDCKFGPREQLSQVTSYVDASTVYSSNAFQTDTLRLFRNGLLQYGKIQSQRPVLPKQDSDLCLRGSLSTRCFRAGDGRLGEFLPPVYGDGVQSVRKSIDGSPLPSARDVTRIIHEDRDVPLASITHMLMQWGQFVDHDLTATGQSRGFNGSIPQCCLNFGKGFQPAEFMHPECLPISVSAEDSFFGPLGVKCLEFLRSGPAPREDCKFGPREQLSQVTSYVDASTVYSSNAFQTDTLRLFRNGLLQYGKIQSQRPVLPKQDSDLCLRGSLSTRCFRAGDGRLGEQPALTSLHVVFLRLHNRIATKLAALNPQWSDEKLFQESRRIVGAVVQHITYREFLPIVLGPDVMKIFDLGVLKKGYYTGYDPSVNPTVANEFSAAAYRFGHSLVQRSFVRFDGNHRPLLNNVTIHREFSNPANLETAGSVDRLLLGLINQPSQKRDEHISDELTNHLFQTPKFPFGMDLASINIQRGRDHGIPPYVQWREPCGLSSIKSFEDLQRAMPPEAAAKFRLVYKFVEDIDLFTAGLAEKSVSGGLVGPTLACIIGQQFSNLRKGDRFWYENPDRENSFTPGQLQQIRRVSLAQVLCGTMDEIETIQPFVFLIQDNLKNQRVSCQDSGIGQLDLEFWKEGPSGVRGRAGFLGPFRKKIPAQNTTAKPMTNGAVVTKVGDQSQKNVLQKGTPTETSIYQSNKIIVRKPLGPPDNVTIVVQNNAVNAPIFVKDGNFGSTVKEDPPKQQIYQPPRPPTDYVNNRPSTLPTRPPTDYVNNRPSTQPPRPPTDYVNNRPSTLPTRPPTDYVNNRPSTLPTRPPFDYINNRPIGPPSRPSSDYVNDIPVDHGPLQQVPIYVNPKPIPTIPPPSPQTGRPYVPLAFDDPNNPNPPSQGFHSNYGLSGVLFENYGSSPRPTLYTYYTNYQRPVTQRPYQDYANDKPQYHDPRPPVSTWPSHEPQYQNNGQITHKPLYGRPGSQYGSVSGYTLNWQELQQQSLMNQLIDPGQYGGRPNKPYESLRDSNWQYQNDRYGTDHRPIEDRPYEYSTWSSVSSNSDRDRYDSNRPYQRPVQADPDGWSSIPTYQKDRPAYQTITSKPIDRVSTDGLYLKSSSEKPWVSEPAKNDYQRPNRPYHNGDVSPPLNIVTRPSYDYHNRFHLSSPRPFTQDQWSESENSYQRPKPSKVHSVTIVTEESAGQDGQNWAGHVTTEVPSPLVTRITDNRHMFRRPGQYYYEKNVLHRYPDNIEIKATTDRHFSTEASVMQRHNALGVAEDNPRDTEAIRNDTKAEVATNAPRNETEDVAAAQGPVEADGVLVNGTSNWLTPQEDSSLPSAPEVPKMSSDQATAAKELPKPIKRRNYAS
nr:uncharacterized protein LOC117226264 [Megalopta genalis]